MLKNNFSTEEEVVGERGTNAPFCHKVALSLSICEMSLNTLKKDHEFNLDSTLNDIFTFFYLST